MIPKKWRLAWRSELSFSKINKQFFTLQEGTALCGRARALLEGLKLCWEAGLVSLVARRILSSLSRQKTLPVYGFAVRS